jgi:hypothetical protein
MIILRQIFGKWDGGMDWIDPARQRDRWRAFVNAVINLWVTWNASISWLSENRLVNMYNISTLIAINSTYLSILFTPYYFFSNWSLFHPFGSSPTSVIYLFQTKLRRWNFEICCRSWTVSTAYEALFESQQLRTWQRCAQFIRDIFEVPKIYI